MLLKKCIKLTALLLLSVICAVYLCSCKALDDAKESHAIYTDGTESAIVWHGQTYRKIDNGDLTFIRSSDYMDKSLNVTAADVPVLLSGSEGDGANVINYDETVISKTGGLTYYIREDCYDKAKSVIKSGELDHYYFTYSERTPDDDDYRDYANMVTGNTGYHDVLLDDETTDIIHRTLSGSDSDKVKWNALKSAETIELDFCDEDMLLTYRDKSISLIREGEDYYIWDGVDNGEYRFHPVKKDDVKPLKALFEQYPNSIEYYDLSEYYEG